MKKTAGFLVGVGIGGMVVSLFLWYSQPENIDFIQQEWCFFESYSSLEEHYYRSPGGNYYIEIDGGKYKVYNKCRV